MARKTFKVAKATRPPEEFALEFEVREQEKVNTGTEEAPTWEMHDIEPPVWVTETAVFHAKMIAPAGLILDTAPASSTDQAEQIKVASRQADGIRRLLRLNVVERGEFEALLDSERTVVDMPHLQEICNWIVEESGERPTTGPSNS